MDRLNIVDGQLSESKYSATNQTVYETNLCRVCLLSGPHINLFDKSTNQRTDNNLNYFVKLMTCVPALNITANDPYTHLICVQCCNLLDQAYEFHLLCIGSDHKLRNPIVDVQIKIETDNELDQRVSDEESDVEERNPCSKRIKIESKNPRNSDGKIKPIKVRKNAALRDENGKYIPRNKRKPKHKCGVCGKLMMSNLALEQHVRTHTGERPFVCEVCGRAFSTRGSIQSHLESHNPYGPKKYNCTLCKFKTHRSIEFVRHAVVHSTERPFQCDVCKGNFKSKIILRNHTNRVHLRKFPVRCCQFCNDKFTTSRGLHDHLSIHYSPKQYRCPECNKLYGVFKSLTNHVSKQHRNLSRPKEADVLVSTNDLMRGPELCDNYPVKGSGMDNYVE